MPTALPSHNFLLKFFFKTCYYDKIYTWKTKLNMSLKLLHKEYLSVASKQSVKSFNFEGHSQTLPPTKLDNKLFEELIQAVCKQTQKWEAGI